MGVYFRYQSKNYDLNENSRSYSWSNDTLREAQEEDLKRWSTYNDEDIVIQYNVNELKDMSDSEIQELWDKYEEDCEMADEFNDIGRQSEKGISCYENIEDLQKYWEQEERNSTGMYLLVFEGEWLCYGRDGEDIVKFEKEIKRVYGVDIDEYIEKIITNEIEF